ncbi:MAG: hypothetical protein U0446_09990 [Dehalococcoidia bacterium]
MQTNSAATWIPRAAERRARAFDAACAHARTHLEDAQQCDLVLSILRAAVERAAAPEVPALFPLTVHMPLAVHAAFEGRDEPALPVAAAGLLVLLGADLLDTLVDDDPFSGPLTPAERLLAGAGLVGPLPTLLLLSMDVPPDIAREAARDLNDAVVTMGAGQLADLRSPAAPYTSLPGVVETAVFKSSPLVAALCRIAARLAGGTPEQAAAAGRLGAALGLADQLRGDWADLGRLDGSNDLRTGAVTIPVALAYERPSLHGDAARHAAGAARDRAWPMLDRDSRAALVNALHFCHQAASAAIDDLLLPEAWSADLSLFANAVCCEGGE